MTTPDYATDFHAWAQAQAEAPRVKDWPLLDVENLVQSWRKFITGLSCQGTPDIGPLERFGHGLVEIVNKGQNMLAEFLHGCTTGPFEEAPHQDAEPDFHLI